MFEVILITLILFGVGLLAVRYLFNILTGQSVGCEQCGQRQLYFPIDDNYTSRKLQSMKR